MKLSRGAITLQAVVSFATLLIASASAYAAETAALKSTAKTNLVAAGILANAVRGLDESSIGAANSLQSLVPSNFGETEAAFPAATGGNTSPPSGPYSHTLTDLIGVDPSGVWRLYVVDDSGTVSGNISGSWCLVFNP